MVLDARDSGCLSYGVEAAGRRVKQAVTQEATESLARAVRLHAAVQHPAIVRPERVVHCPDGLTMVYPWCDGSVLNRTTAHGTGRTALARFQQLPVPEVEAVLAGG